MYGLRTTYFCQQFHFTSSLGYPVPMLASDDSPVREFIPRLAPASASRSINPRKYPFDHPAVGSPKASFVLFTRP